MKYKELAVEFIRNSDGTISVKMKPSECEYSDAELYMAYRYLRQVLEDVHFDWSIEGTIETITVKKEEK